MPPVAEMAVSLYSANEGYIDDVPLKKVVDFESALHSYMRSSHAELLAKINEKGDYNDEIANSLKAALEDFKTNHTY